MSIYRVIDPRGDVVATRDIESADDAHAWFVDRAAQNDRLGWRMEVQDGTEWRFFDSSDGTPSN